MHFLQFTCKHYDPICAIYRWGKKDNGTHNLLTIETHVLSKWLRQEDVVALLNKISHSPGISINISTSKALVSHVKEHQKFLLLQREKEDNKTVKQCQDNSLECLYHHCFFLLCFWSHASVKWKRRQGGYKQKHHTRAP